jgi:hypothetical protein
MSITDLRTAVTTAGGTPTRFDQVNLYRELITAWGGSPSGWTVPNLLRELVVLAGGTPTRWDYVGLLRELVTALGGTPATHYPDALEAQVAGLALLASFDPSELSPSLWLDSADIATMFQDSAGTIPVTTAADPVGRISDKSGADRHIVQATAGSRPAFRQTSGKNGWENDGVDDNLATAAGQTWPASCDVFIVMSNPSDDTNFVLLHPSTGGGTFMFAATSGSASTSTDDTSTQPFVNNVLSTTRGTNYSATAGGGPKIVEYRAASIAILTTATFGLYPTFAFGGRYHEVLVFPALSAADRTAVRDYLTAKWGVA